MSYLFDRKPKILIVDDIPLNIELLNSYLKSSGYETYNANNGDDALKNVKVNKPDLILIDTKLPVINGFEVCRKIKSNPKSQFIPIIIVTSLQNIEDRINGIEAGADDFISKPFSKAEILARVKSLLRIKFLHDELEDKMKQISEEQDKLRKTNDRMMKIIIDLKAFEKDALDNGGVFISYCHEDKKIADRITEGFAKDKINYWRDDEEILAGELIDKAISKGIQNNIVFLILLTPSSIDSNWVKRELDEAIHAETQGKKIVIPIIANGLTGKDVPTRIQTKYYVDLNKNFNQGYEKLKKAIIVYLKRFAKNRTQLINDN